MAIDLIARLQLQDQVSGQLRRISNNLNAVDRNTSFSNVKNAVVGLAASIGTAVGAAKILDATIGEAMRYEQSEVLVTAIFDDKKASNQYQDMIKKMAEASPILDTSNMMSGSKALLGVTKDLPTLEKAWKIAEKLSIMDPAQGLEGAVYAMKELASGDGVSMAERFEMPKSVVNDIKNLKFEDQLAAMQKYLDKTGITNKTIDAMGNTTIAKWNQVKEKTTSIFRAMGESSNGVLNESITKLLAVLDGGTFDKVANLAGTALASVVSNVTNAIASLDFTKVAAGMETTIKFVSESLELVFDVGKKIAENWDNVSVVVVAAGAAFVAFKAIMAGMTIISGITTLITAFKVALGLTTAAQTGLNLAMMANPIGILIAAIAGLVAAGVLLYKNWDTVKAKTLALWEQIKQGKGAIFLVLGPVGQLIKTAIDLARNWDSTKSVWQNVWGAIKRSAADSVNSVISGINKMIETINSLPGVNIPVIAKVDWGSEGGALGSVDSKVHAPSMSTNVNGPHALGNHAGLGDVRGTTYRKLHDGEAVLTRMENANYKRIKQGDMGAVASAMNSSVGFNADAATATRTQAAPQLSVTGNTFVVREEADIDRIIETIADRLAIL